MSKQDFYQILEINKDASQEEIKKAFRSKSKIHHPDKEGGDENLFKEIAEAYETLSNPETRTKYDQFGHNYKNPQFNQHQGFNHPDLDDLLRAHGFGGFGRHNRNQIIKGSNLTINLNLTLEEIYSGLEKKLKFKRKDGCKLCNSNGGNGEIMCSTCNGIGRVIQRQQTQFGIFQTETICPNCQGNGKTYQNICTTCNGEGLQLIEDIIDIIVPAGVTNGMTFVLDQRGQGIKNGICGDLHIVIHEIPHKEFVRQNNDLKYHLKLNYPQLVLGDNVEIPTIEGRNIRIPVPEYSNVGDNLKVNGKGMKILNSDNYGDLYIVLDIEIPKEINDNERKLLKKLMDINKNIKF
jgi:molecular chaperone DnaJ